MSNKPKSKTKKTKGVVPTPQQKERQLFRPDATLPITRDELDILYEKVKNARNRRVGVTNVMDEEKVLEGQNANGLDLPLERLFVHATRVYEKFEVTEDSKAEDVLEISGEEFLTLHLQIIQVRNAKTIIVKVPFNGQMLDGQGIATEDLDLDDLSLYVEKIYQRFLTLGFGVSRANLIEEMGLNDTEAE